MGLWCTTHKCVLRDLTNHVIRILTQIFLLLLYVKLSGFGKTRITLGV